MNAKARSASCSHVYEGLSRPSNIEQASSLPTSLSSLRNSIESESSTGSKNSCGADCLVTQTIIDKLLARMIDLENERSELLAANRSWAAQFQLTKSNHQTEIKTLQQQVELAKHENKLSRKSNKSGEFSLNWKETRDQMNLLKHQADVYREDFMEERKARVRAHAQIEALRGEIKRERKSRAKLTSLAHPNQTERVVT